MAFVIVLDVQVHVFVFSLHSEDTDEIVECDLCGVPVHEGKQ